MIQKFIVFILIICCLINLIRSESSESEGDYDQDEEDEFAQMNDNNNNNNLKVEKMNMGNMDKMVMGRARDPEYDEFEQMDKEFGNDNEKDHFMSENGKPKSKDDIEFQLAFGGNDEDNSNEKGEEGEKDEFYKTVKDDLDDDFNMYSSNKMNKRIKCDNPEDCDEQAQFRNQQADDSLKNNRSINQLDDSDKTTIVNLNNPTTNRPNSYATSRLHTKPQQRQQPQQYEEATNLKADHQEDDRWNSPLECDCDIKVQPKIIGGTAAAKSRYPYAVAIFTLVGRGSFCGGTNL